MLNGEHGSAVQKAMELLVKVGNAYGAERMIDVTQSYVAFPLSEENQSFFDIIYALTENVTVKIPTTNLPLPLDLQRINELGLPESVIETAQKIMLQRMEIYRRIGVIPSYTCDPHFLYYLRKGEHVAFTETNVAMLTNSWFGSRTNIEGMSTAMASAITGKTPEYGLHLQENRYGQVLIEVSADLETERFDYADYVALAHWTGKILFDQIAVYNGLPKNIRPDHVKYMCASQIYNSAAGMFHIVGVTPEAPTLEAAFGGKKPAQRFIFGRKERAEAYEEFCSATEKKVDMVVVGCPHCSLNEISEIAQLLNGRKINKDVRLWIGTSLHTRALAERMGLVDITEGAGGLILTDVCIRAAVLPPYSEALGVRVLATTSGSIAQNAYRRSKGKTTAWFGSMKDCIDASVKGKWEGR